jgi:hypothetical protein
VRGARGTPTAGLRFRPMGVFRDPLVLLLILTVAAIAFFLVATAS